MSSTAPSEMFFTYKKHRASTATWRNRVPKQTFLGYEDPWKRKQIVHFQSHLKKNDGTEIYDVIDAVVKIHS